MIDRIKLLQNIGRFNSDAAGTSHELSQLTLIYADNAQGKTTLTSILRSLASGDPLPITERRRLGSQYPPKVVLDWRGEPADVIFQNGAWNHTFGNLKVFDDNFVDENVYSGLDVASSHRQNLHELILGDRGVALNRTLQALVSRVTEHNATISTHSEAIPERERYGLSVEAFCALTELSELDGKIDAAERALKVVQDQESVLRAPIFPSIELPEFDIEAIRETLGKDLDGLDKSAEAQVQAHIQPLGEGGESWVSDGVEKARQRDENVCPFCGQDMHGIDLVAHYRAYFSQEYANLKQTVSQLISHVARNHADGKHVGFERAVSTLTQSMRFWSIYCDVPTVEIDSAAIVDAWNAARTPVAEQLQAKMAAPLETQSLNQTSVAALDAYDGQRQALAATNQMLQTTNLEIQQVKQQAQTADTNEMSTTLNRLKATKSCFREDIAPLCDAYLAELAAKEATETARDQARDALEEYRTNVFPQLEEGVNDYLDRFNAGFRIGSLTPANIGAGSGSTCTYNVLINNSPIAVRSNTNTPGEPSFRNSLSAGDRNTLALALFFSSLDRNPNLADTVVVVDDPMSSLDDQRSLATVQRVRALSRQAKQTIVLSHNKRFLCGILDGLNRREECATLVIAPNGNESTIRKWEASQDSITEHDQRYPLLAGYATDQSGVDRDVAEAIRFYLEGYFRVACPGRFPPGKLLGPFIRECRQQIGGLDEVIDDKTIEELENILEYANRFHHDTNPAWQAEYINPTELLGFVRRTLVLAGPPTVS